MTSAIALFGAFGNAGIRWNGNSDKPWWVAQDVCAVLGLKDVSKAVSTLKEYEKDYFSLSVDDTNISRDTLGRIQPLLIVNESGLYRLIFKSRKPEAEKFRAWVFEEVLPSIRKYGYYPPPVEEEELTLEQAMFVLLVRSGLEKNEMRVLATLGFAERDEETTNASVAEFLELDELKVAEIIERLQALELIDDQRLVLLPDDLLPTTHHLPPID